MAEELRKNWKASINLENLTKAQVKELTRKMADLVDAMGGYMGGGFIPEEEGDGQQQDAGSMPEGE